MVATLGLRVLGSLAKQGSGGCPGPTAPIRGFYVEYFFYCRDRPGAMRMRFQWTPAPPSP